MAKTIEEIWQKGFQGEPEMLPPKLNELYSKKSHNIIEKQKRMYDLNVKFLFWGAFAIGAIFIGLGAPILGIGMAAMLLWLCYEAKEPLAEIKKLEPGDNVYIYMTEFQTWRDRVVKQFTRVYTVFYPLLFVLGAVQCYHTDIGQKVLSGLLQKFPDVYTIVGLPWGLVLAAGGITILLTIFGGALYRLDMNIVYGRDFARIDEIIKDLEELKD